jgi:hypothetical protein
VFNISSTTFSFAAVSSPSERGGVGAGGSGARSGVETSVVVGVEGDGVLDTSIGGGGEVGVTPVLLAASSIAFCASDLAASRISSGIKIH